MDTDMYYSEKLQAGSKGIHERDLEHIKKQQEQYDRVKYLKTDIQLKELSPNNQLPQKTQEKEQWLYLSVQEVKKVNITLKF